MQDTFIRELLGNLIQDPLLTTKRDYQKTKNALLSKYGSQVEDISSIEVIEVYRRHIDSKDLSYDSRVWKMLRKR